MEKPARRLVPGVLGIAPEASCLLDNVVADIVAALKAGARELKPKITEKCVEPTEYSLPILRSPCHSDTLLFYLSAWAAMTRWPATQGVEVRAPASRLQPQSPSSQGPKKLLDLLRDNGATRSPVRAWRPTREPPGLHVTLIAGPRGTASSGCGASRARGRMQKPTAAPTSNCRRANLSASRRVSTEPGSPDLA